MGLLVTHSVPASYSHTGWRQKLPEVSNPVDLNGLYSGRGEHSNKLWKILKEMGIPDHLICLLRNLYTGQEATVRTGHGTTDWFQIGKGVHQAVYCHPAHLTYMQSTS